MYISSSILHTTYSEKLTLRLKKQTKSDPASEWSHYLRDHIYQIRDNSTIVTMDPLDMNRYRYRVRDYIERVLSLPGELEIPFRIVNRLSSDLKFDDSVTSLYVPNFSYIASLRTKYNTVMANYRRKAV